MKHYCETIPITLAEKLKEKGMPYIEIDCETYDSGTEYQRDEVWCNNTYAEVFDWLMKEEIYITIGRNILDPAHYHGEVFRFARFENLANGDTWHEAANAAIEKALELI